MRVDAIVLAGAKNDGKLQEISSCQYEALIEINSKPMLSYVISALKKSAQIGKIVVIGYPEFRDYLDEDIILLECSESLVDNIEIGMDYLGARNHVLVVTSDIPMLTCEAVDDFIKRCQGYTEDLFYPIVSKTANDQVYPGVKRTYVQLKDGIYTGGNMVLMTPEFIRDARHVIHHVVRLRKKPFQIVRLLGLRFLIKFVLRRLTIAEVESRVQNLFGINAKAVITAYPQIGTDVDKPTDLELAQRVLHQNQIKEA